MEEHPGRRKPRHVWVERAFVCLGVLGVKAKLCATPDSGCPLLIKRKNETMLLPIPSSLERMKDRSVKLLFGS